MNDLCKKQYKLVLYDANMRMQNACISNTSHQRFHRSLHLRASSALHLTATLSIAHFWFCHIPKIDVGPVILFPHLNHVQLNNVIISKADIHCLIDGCTALEGLEINVIYGLTSGHIVPPTIRTFIFSGYW
jgi:hypothetical protein